ncbi:MAG: glutaconyl-CoA decarboxylase subunit delta [Clostridiales bacterium]|nr:glutaconyl-CoA decarboxylase subunit delta [Clostridiales bacterium]
MDTILIIVGLVALVAIVALIARRRSSGKAVEAAPGPAPVPEALEPAVEPGIDPSVVAVIAAAIAAFDGGSKALVVRSIRRASGWTRAARAEQVYRF